MPNKIKLHLTDLNISSFKTSKENKIKGGNLVTKQCASNWHNGRECTVDSCPWTYTRYQDCEVKSFNCEKY